MHFDFESKSFCGDKYREYLIERIKSQKEFCDFILDKYGYSRAYQHYQYLDTLVEKLAFFNEKKRPVKFKIGDKVF